MKRVACFILGVVLASVQFCGAGTLIQDPKPVGSATALMDFIANAGGLEVDPATHQLVHVTAGQFYQANPPDWSNITSKPAFSLVSTSGSYNDLLNRPALFSGNYVDLQGKPTLFSGNYADLQGKPSLFSGSYLDLTNKPVFASVATSGQYGDLQNKPVAGVDFVAPNGSGAGLKNLNASQLSSGTAPFDALPPTLIHNYTTEATTAIAQRIVGKTASATTMAAFSSVDDVNHVYVRNPNLWCADLSPTSVSAATSVGWRITMVTPKHGLTAHHIGMPVGTIGYWVDANNTTYSRTVKFVVNVTGDMDMVTLDSDLPASIIPSPILPLVLPDGFQTGVGSLAGIAGAGGGVPVITHDQNRHFCIAILTGLQYQTGTPPNDSLAMPTSGPYSPWNRNNDTPGNTQGTPAITNDSSSPYFVVIAGKPILLGCFFGTLGSGPDPGGNVQALQAAIGSGYSLNVVPMPGYPLPTVPAAIWAGDPYSGVYLSGGSQESWNGAAARTTVQSVSGQHAFLAHSTGNGGMAFVGWSSTGAQAVKAVQDSFYTQSTLYGYRSTNTTSMDAAEFELKQGGSADFQRFVTLGGSVLSRVDANGAVHPPHLTDEVAAFDSLYFSNTTSGLSYKDAQGGVHTIGDGSGANPPGGANSSGTPATFPFLGIPYSPSAGGTVRPAMGADVEALLASGPPLANTSHKLQPLPGNAIIAAYSLPAPTFPTSGTFTGAATTGGALAANTTYYYRVTAYNGNGETLPSAEVSTTTAVGTSTNQVTLNWNAVAGAISYNVYRGTAAGSELFIGYVTGTSYADTANVTPAGALPTLNTTSNGFGQRTLALFHCDEGSGTTLTDSSGNGYVGTYNGAWGPEAARVSYDPLRTPGAGYSLALDGASSYVTVPALLDTCPADFTVSMQVRVPAGGLIDNPPQYLFSKDWGGSHNLRAYTFQGKLFAALNGFALQIYSTALTWTPGTTYGVTYVFTPSRVMIFRSDPALGQVVLVADTWRDANALGTATFTNFPAPGLQGNPGSSYFSGTSPLAMCFGASNVGGTVGNYGTVTLDEIIIEDHAWTPEEIDVRTVRWQTYNNPTTERAKWQRSNQPTFFATQPWEQTGLASGYGVGEPTLIWEASIKRIHMIYTAGRGPACTGYAYSDNYGRTWVKPLTAPVLGNGSGGVAAGAMATHSSALLAPDGYVYIAFSQETTSIYLAKSNLTTAGAAHTLTQVMQGGFTGGTGTAIVTASTFSNSGPLGSITYLGNSSLVNAGGTFYVAVETGYSGTYQSLFAKCATINGTYAAVTPTMPASLQPPGTTNSYMSAALLIYEPTQGIFHLYPQFQNDPCEIWHWVSADCINWVQSSTAENNPVFLFGRTNANNIANGSYADQLGDPAVVEVSAPDGSKMCIATATYVNNAAAGAAGQVYTYTYAGSLASTAALSPLTLSPSPTPAQ